MSEIWIAGVATAVVGAGTSLYEASEAKTSASEALDAQEKLEQETTYTPINISQLQEQATQASIQNATNSLQLQRQLTPGVYASNQALQKSVAQGIQAGGQLTPDEQSQVAQQARIAGGTSGAVGGVGPYTAALTGQSANALLQQRQNASLELAAANPAPAVGLSASDLASATIANSNAQNQFALSKLGVSSNVINSNAQAQAAADGAVAGGVGSSISGAAALAKALGTNASSTPSSPALTTGQVSAAEQPFTTDPNAFTGAGATGFGGLT